MEEYENQSENEIQMIDELSNKISQYEKGETNKSPDITPPVVVLTQTDKTTKEYTKTIQTNIYDNESEIEVKKYALGNKDISYFENDGIVLTNDSFSVSTNDFKRLEGADLSNIQYTVYAKNKEGLETVETITVEKLLILYNLNGLNGLLCKYGASADSDSGAITLANDSVQYGPYCVLPVGSYQVSYNTNNYSNLSYEIYYNAGSSKIVTGNFYDNVTIVNFSISTTTTDIEMVSRNNGTDNAIIYNIELKQID